MRWMRPSVRQQVEAEKAHEAKSMATQLPRHKRVAAYIADNQFFTFATTLLTIYALTGDDFRLMATNLPEDIIFDCMTVFCILVFAVEIVCSCLGKSDYLNGFFFWLDLISTVTLVLDITTVNDYCFQNSEEDVAAMKNSRTARIGARAARVVRVLRLVRILKLYK